MCGLWGFNGKPDKNIISIISKKADERGGHSFGFYGIDKKGQEVYFKKQGRIDVELITYLADDCIMGIGNSRLVTSGDNTLFNSQPLLVQKTAIVHNGNIENYKSIFNDFNYKPIYKVDSEAIIPLINEKNKKIKGSYLSITNKGLNSVFSYYDSGHIATALYVNNLKKTKYFCSKKWEKQF